MSILICQHIGAWYLFLEQFFNYNSNVISFCTHSNSNRLIASNFSTWHNSCAVVSCAKICSNIIVSNGVTAKWIFHQTLIMIETELAKLGPEQNGSHSADDILGCIFLGEIFCSLLCISLNFVCKSSICISYHYTLCSTKLKGVYWFHLVHLSVCPLVRLWTESCPLCIFHNTCWIHFIFTHLIKQIQEMYHVYNIFQN